MFNSPMRQAVGPLLVLALALLLPGCARKDPARSDQLVPAAASVPTRSDGLKVAFVYVGPVGEGGWTYAHDQARKMIEAELGDRIETTFVENVPEGPPAERVFRDLARQGNRLIFGTTYGYMDAMLKVAWEFPAVKFEHATGDKTAANLATYEARTYEGAYLAGIIAGKMTLTDRLGFVASIPIPEVIRNINAYTLGAQSVNPKISTEVIWVNQWIDPARERAAALTLIAHGADVLIQNTDSNAVLKAAQEKGVMAFGWDSDMAQYGPGAHLGSAAINWAPYYKKRVEDVLDGKWKSGSAWWGVKENAIRIASPSPKIPHDILLFLGEKTRDMKSGRLKPFQGPIVDQSGAERLSAGAALDDRALKSMHFYVKGVLGSIPK